MAELTFVLVGVVEMYAFIWAAAESDVLGAISCAVALVLTAGLAGMMRESRLGGRHGKL